MSVKGIEEVIIIITSTNTKVYIEMLLSLLILSAESMFGDDDFIFQDDNASRQKGIKRSRRNVKMLMVMAWPANSPELGRQLKTLDN